MARWTTGDTNKLTIPTTTNNIPVLAEKTHHNRTPTASRGPMAIRRCRYEVAETVATSTSGPRPKYLFTLWPTDDRGFVSGPSLDIGYLRLAPKSIGWPSRRRP